MESLYYTLYRLTRGHRHCLGVRWKQSFAFRKEGHASFVSLAIFINVSTMKFTESYILYDMCLLKIGIGI